MNDEQAVNRRQALLALAKLSAYTAPTVVTMLSASSSYAAGSCPGAIVDEVRVQISIADMGMGRDNTDTSVSVGDGSTMSVQGSMDSTVDCMI